MKMTLPFSRGRFSLRSIFQSVNSISAIIVGLALSLSFASLFLISFPVGSTVRGYFYGVDSLRKLEVQVRPRNQSEAAIIHIHGSKPNGSKSVNILEGNFSSTGIRSNGSQSELVDSDINPDQSSEYVVNGSRISDPGKLVLSPSSSNLIDGIELPDTSDLSNKTKSSCDLYQGEWFYDPSGPLYTNNTCPILTQMQNCQGNGRPDKDYEYWRWRPSGCHLPRFDPHEFFQLMAGKTLAFVGDSVARNQMESMLCILWQAEVPKNRGNRKMQRWYFRSSSTMIVRIWSSWLVRQTSEKLEYAPEGVVKLHLDAPDSFIELITGFDVIIISSGHWFAKQSVYVLNNEIVGGQLWWPDKSTPMKVNNIEAFGISVETILSAIAAHPNYTGLTIVRSYSPDHYEGGAWNTGGSCTGKVRPALPGTVAENGFTNVMHEKQVMGFHKALRDTQNGSKLRLMDITESFSYRHDGHPGPYRSPDPNKITKRGPDGKPPPQDCLHWCMPGPVDTWNELVLEIIRREFVATKKSILLN